MIPLGNDDTVKTLPLAIVSQVSREHDVLGKKADNEKIFGKTERRQAVNRLREKTSKAPDFSMVNKPTESRLDSLLKNEAAKIHRPFRSSFAKAANKQTVNTNLDTTFVQLDPDQVGMHDSHEKDSSGAGLDTRSTPHHADANAGGTTSIDLNRQFTENNSPPSPSHVNQEEHDMKTSVTHIRDYLDLLDEYSLHHFVIWQGKVIDETPEFLSLKRTNQAIWNSLSRCVAMLEGVMSQNGVPLAIIDGKQLAELATFDLERIEEEDLCSCIANLEQVRPLLRHMGVISKYRSQAHQAAFTIQSACRMFLQRCRYLQVKLHHCAAVQLQRIFRGHTCRRDVAVIFAQRQHDLESRWDGLQRSLRNGWDSWRGGERVIVHIPSLAVCEYARMGDDGFPLRQNLQVSRICSLMDQQVHVIYVSPFHLSTEILEYHKKILELAGIPNPRERLSVVVPEHYGVFPGNLPLSSLLLYSPGCMKRITNIVKGRPALIVSGVVGWQEKRLAVLLGAPLLSADPEVAMLLSTWSGMKHVFQAADVNVPYGAHDVYDEEDFMVALTKLIASNLEVQRWHIRVDVCYDNLGHAVFDTAALTCMEGLKRERAHLVRTNNGLPAVWNHPDVQLLARARLLKDLQGCLPRTVLVVNRVAYPTWGAFLGHIGRVGCVIEAEPTQEIGHPSVSLFITPTGDVSVIAEMDLLYGGSYVCAGVVHPQSCVPEKALHGASLAVGHELFRRGVMGYCSINFVAFWDSQARSARLWATNLQLGLSWSTCSYFFFSALTQRAGIEQNLGCFHSVRNEGSGEPMLHYTYIDYIHHRGLASMQLAAFFKLCRLEGVYFDVETQMGTIFNLVDILGSGTVGMLAVGSSRQTVLQKAFSGLKFIKQIVR
ncbi:unnamed protein product, partial [Discosporangium mesarthrocarpum]